MEKSHPTRGGWIEIMRRCGKSASGGSHPTRGGWIEIWCKGVREIWMKRPTPHGVGGLKSETATVGQTNVVVPPHTGWVD